MVAFTSVWEDEHILPKLRSGKRSDIYEGCCLLVDDDTGDVDEVKVELANIILSNITSIEHKP